MWKFDELCLFRVCLKVHLRSFIESQVACCPLNSEISVYFRSQFQFGFSLSKHTFKFAFYRHFKTSGYAHYWVTSERRRMEIRLAAFAYSPSVCHDNQNAQKVSLCFCLFAPSSQILSPLSSYVKSTTMHWIYVKNFLDWKIWIWET